MFTERGVIKSMNDQKDPELMKKRIREILDQVDTEAVRQDEYETIFEVVSVLGSTDSELRDELGYTTLAELLINKKFLNERELKELLIEVTSDNMLFYKIGEVDTDSVFLRSFSSLLLALLLYRENQENFLSKSDFDEVVEKVVKYCSKEKDYRGFVDGKGWAHATAHIADVIDECVTNQHADLGTYKKLWRALSDLLLNAPVVFDSEEDERIATPVIAMIESEKVSLSSVRTWLSEIDIQTVNMHTRINIKNFTRSFLIRLLISDIDVDSEEVISMIEEFEHKINADFLL